MPGTFCFPTLGTTAHGRALLLAIDDHSLPLKRNLCTYLSKPAVRAEPVLAPSPDPDAPDHYSADFYGTVLHDGGRFRMWYSASHVSNPDWPASVQALMKRKLVAVSILNGPLCYAESDDGIHWTKPELGQLRFHGSTAHNALGLPDALTCAATVAKDEVDRDPSRRYKMVYQRFSDLERPAHGAELRTATSPNGLHWAVAPGTPIDEFMEWASFYRFGDLWIVNGHSISPWRHSEGGAGSGRQGYAWVSPDFDRWLPESAGSFLLPEPAEPAERGHYGEYEQVHIGTGAASFGNVAVGLFCRWYNHGYNASDFGRISGDLSLVVSNDGLAFREPVKGHVWLASTDSPAPPVDGQTYPTILCQGNGILNVGDETRIYHSRWRNANPLNVGGPAHHNYGEIALATLPRDRWGGGGLGLFPQATEGSVWSAPVTLPRGGCTVRLNADGVVSMRVELADERFGLLAAWSGERAGTVAATGGLDCPVTWPRGDLAALGGQTVRLRVRVSQVADVAPRLYAIYLSET